MKPELAASLFLLLLTATVVRSGLILRPPVGEYLYAEVETEIEIECRYTGNGDGVFTWTGPALMSGGNRVETVLGQSPTGHPNSVLRIRDVCVSDAGTYHCRHSAVNDEELIRVNVTADPMITSAPSSQEFVEGADALVMCVVDLGMPQGHILWYKDGRAVEYSDRIYINGQSGLQINSIEQENAGEYTCVVERQGWGSEQVEITVTVTTPGCEAPKIDATSMSAHLEVLYNESLDITCLLQPDSGSAEIWWTTPTGGIVRQPDLHVEPPCSPGGYICVANSLENCGSESHAVAVSVLAPPSPPSRDEEIATSEGATVVLECSVDEMPIANPEPTYTWRYLSDGSSEFPARMVVTDKNDLKIIGVTAEDYTKYECIVENRIGRSVVVVQLTPPTPTPMPSPMPSPTPSPTPMPTPTPMTKASVTLFLEYQVPYEVSIDCHPVLIYPQLGQKIEEEMKTLCDCTEISLTPYLKCLSDNTKAIYTLTVEAVEAQELVDRFITNVDTGMWKPDIPGLTVTTCESEEACTPPPPTSDPQTGEDDAAVRNGLIGGILIVAIVCVASIVAGVIYCSYKSRKSRVATSTDPELAKNQETTTAPDPLQDLQQNHELLQSYLVCTHPGIPHTVVNTDLHYPNPPQCLLHQGCVRMNVSHVHPPSQAPPFTSRSPPTRPPSSQRPTSLPLHHSTHQQSEH